MVPKSILFLIYIFWKQSLINNFFMDCWVFFNFTRLSTVHSVLESLRVFNMLRPLKNVGSSWILLHKFVGSYTAYIVISSYLQLKIVNLVTWFQKKKKRKMLIAEI